MMKMSMEQAIRKKKEKMENRLKYEIKEEEKKIKQKENELLFWKMQYENKINI